MEISVEKNKAFRPGLGFVHVPEIAIDRNLHVHAVFFSPVLLALLLHEAFSAKLSAWSCRYVRKMEVKNVDLLLHICQHDNNSRTNTLPVEFIISSNKDLYFWTAGGFL